MLTACSVVLGGFLMSGGSIAMNPDAMGPANSFQDSLRSNLSDGEPERDEMIRKSNRWSDAAVRLGVSFMAAMIFGSLLRVALKTAISIVIIGGALLWLLQTQGIIDPIWDDYYGSVRESRGWLMSRVEGVGYFLQTHLPSASAALIGFLFGLRR